MATPLYLDAAATSAVDARVVDVMLHFLREEYGNAGSRTHVYGSDALKAVEAARASIAKVVEAATDEVYFTSGATESNNLAILGLQPHAIEAGRRHIVSTAIEHKAVLEPLELLSSNGFEVSLVRPGHDGRVAAEALLSEVRDDTLLVTVMHVNNETGMIQPIDEICAGLGGHRALLHVDAAQGFGKLIATLRNPRIDLISISGHKIYGPKGIGALIARRRDGRSRPPLTPLFRGGGQEFGLRPGTLPVHLIAGLGEAARLALSEADDRARSARHTEQQLLRFIADAGGEVNGDRSHALPHIINASFKGLDSEAFIVATKDLIAVSNGSACTSHSYEQSHVLTAMGLPERRISGAIRFSFSHDTGLPDTEELRRRIEQVRF